MIWKELIKVALLGTDRASLSASARQRLAKLGVPESMPAEQELLAAAALISRQQRAGYQPTPNTDAIDIPDIDPTRACSQSSVAHLQQILAEEAWRDRLLPEFLSALQKRQLALPPEMLPDLLQLACQEAELRPLLMPAFGKLASWLASLHPVWKALFPPLQEVDWSTANHAQRLQAFQHLYGRQKEAALADLLEYWPDEAFRHKLDFLRIIEEEPHAAAEYLLEMALDDGRKEVRQKAAALLLRLPDSALVQRMYQRACQWVRLKPGKAKGAKLEITLPEETDSIMLRDGIDPSLPGYYWAKGGLKASRLLQILAALPPGRWNELLACDAAAGLPILVRSQWSELLLEAVIRSAFVHADLPWAECLIRFWIDQFGKLRWQELDVSPLFGVMNNELFAELAIYSLKKAPAGIEEEVPASILLKLRGFQWPDQLTFLCIKKIQRWIVNERSHYWDAWPYQGILRNAAFSCSPDLFSHFNHKWPRREQAWLKLEAEVDEFLAILRFRKEMMAGLV